MNFAPLSLFIAVIVPFISLQRVFNGVVNGLSKYKKFAKIDLFSFLFSAALLVFFLLNYNIEGALFAIILVPAVQLTVLIVIFYRFHIEDSLCAMHIVETLHAMSLLSPTNQVYCSESSYKKDKA